MKLPILMLLMPVSTPRLVSPLAPDDLMKTVGSPPCTARNVSIRSEG